MRKKWYFAVALSVCGLSMQVDASNVDITKDEWLHYTKFMQRVYDNIQDFDKQPEDLRISVILGKYELDRAHDPSRAAELKEAMAKDIDAISNTPTR